jgi:hypothetical protein
MAILAANPGLDSEAMPVGKTITLPTIDGRKPTVPPEVGNEDTPPSPSTP